MRFSKWLLTAMVLALSAAALAEISIEKQKELAKMRERPTLADRKRITVDGKDYIVERWLNTPEKREWRTNEVFKVAGKKQTTSWSRVKAELEEKVAAAEGDAKEMRELKKVVKKAGKNLEKVVKTIEKAYEKSSSDEERELYAALLSVINGEEE